MSEETGEAVVRSGFNKAWTDSLDDISAKQCREYVASLAEMPIKRCDTLFNCDEPATFWVQDATDSFCVCDTHRTMFTEPGVTWRKI